MMNKIIQYFDLASQYRPGGSRAVSQTVTLHWFWQYLALLAGIVVQPYFQRYMTSGQHWEMSGFFGWGIASLVIAVMAFPAVYKASFDATKPIAVQLFVIFTTGTGWQTLATSALKAVTPK